MKAFQRDFFREIRKNRGRFFSVLFIVMLGAAFFSGIRSNQEDMHRSADSYYDQVDFMDIKVVSTMGLTEDDLSDMRGVKGVQNVVGGHTAEVLSQNSDMQLALRVIGLTENVNQVTVTQGRLPEKADECLADNLYLEQTGAKIGDTITFLSGSQDALSDTLEEETFTIVGSGNLPYYMEMDRGTGTVGDGSIDAFMVVLPEVFAQQDIYSEAYVQVEGAEALNSFEEAYDRKVADVTKGLEAIAGDAGERRYENVVSDAEQELLDAKKEVGDAERELADAKEKLTDGEQQLSDAGTTLADGEQELAKGEQEVAEKEQELADAKKQLADEEAGLLSGKEQLADGERQLRDADALLSSKEQELNRQKQMVETKAEELESGKALLLDKEQKLEDNRTLLEQEAEKLAMAKEEMQAKAEELEMAKEELAAGRSQLEAAKEELAAGKSQLEAGRQQLAQSHQELELKKQELENSRPDYEQAKQTFDQIVPQLNELEKCLAEVIEKIRILEEELASAGEETSPEYEALLQQKKELEEQIKALSAQKEMLAGQIAAFEAGEQQIRNGETELAAAGQALKEQEAKLQEGERQIREKEQALETAQQEISNGETQIEEARQQIAKGEQGIQAGREEISKGEAQIAEAHRQFSEGEAQIRDAKNQISSGEAQLKSGKQELEQKGSLLEQTKAQIADGERQLADAKKQLSEGETQLSEAKKTLEESRQELTDGKEELAEKEQELLDARAEYEEAYREAQPKLADARQEIADGEKQLRELEKPEWYVMDRDDVTSAKGFRDDAERVAKVGEVFPLIFFLVAALVSLTTMTRMVEEQRQQIGTLKALGYRDGAIAMKYFCYAMLATVSGAVLGVILGEKIFPWVIMNAYGMLYMGLPEYLTPLNYEQGLLAVLASMACTGAATLLACKRELKAKPSELMRPEPPKNGKRVLLERITILWKHLSFTEKSTVRNLFRYKKRFFMTVIGIGGCMGLILVGFGLQDSITAVAKNQFTELFTYQAAATLHTDSDEEKEAVLETVNTYENMDQTLEVYAQKVALQAGENSMDAILQVPKEASLADQFFTFRDRKSGHDYEFPSDGAAVSEKTAKMLGISPGDTLLVGEENAKGQEVRVSIVIENYVEHYIFMGPELYQQIFGEAPDYNQILMKYQDTSDAYETKLGEMVIEQNAVVGVTFISDLEAEIDDMLQALNIVIVVLIVSAGLLAFVVLYNLNNINITERKRELATLKVLGFYDLEVAEYVYRENVILTVFGILAGAGIGMVLHQYIIQTVEVDMMMFGRSVFFRSYLFSGLLTLLFSLFVNYIMYYRLRRIDMIESLKSVE